MNRVSWLVCLWLTADKQRFGCAVSFPPDEPPRLHWREIFARAFFEDKNPFIR
jgi:hypothetical protein